MAHIGRQVFGMLQYLPTFIVLKQFDMEQQSITLEQLSRLKELANHLRTGKIGVDEFSFRVFYQKRTDSDGVCKTLGCALGECTTLWPEHWMWIGSSPVIVEHEDLDQLIDLKREIDSSTAMSEAFDILAELETAVYESASTWFGISREAVLHLFVPTSQQPTLYGGKVLNSHATADEVADNILAFIETLADNMPVFLTEKAAV